MASSSTILQSHVLHHKIKSNTWCSGTKSWMGVLEKSLNRLFFFFILSVFFICFSLFVSEAQSSASQRTSSCYDQLDQCLNCLHWIFHSYQRPSWHRWWTSPGFDTWNLKKKEDIFRLERTADTSHNSWKKLNKTENTGLALTSARGF